MLDKWMCKFVNCFEENDDYKHKTITIGDLFIQIFMLFIALVVFGLPCCVGFGLMYCMIWNSAATEYQILFS